MPGRADTQITLARTGIPHGIQGEPSSAAADPRDGHRDVEHYLPRLVLRPRQPDADHPPSRHSDVGAPPDGRYQQVDRRNPLPRDVSGMPLLEPPDGISHHYAPLAWITAATKTPVDLREQFRPFTHPVPPLA